MIFAARCGMLEKRTGAAANSPPVALGIASGVCLATGTPGALLLLVQPVKLAAEVVKVFALGGKPVDLFELDL